MTADTPILLQAEIAANLGDRDRAIVLLEQALTRGIGLQHLGAGMFGNANLAAALRLTLHSSACCALNQSR